MLEYSGKGTAAELFDYYIQDLQSGGRVVELV